MSQNDSYKGLEAYYLTNNDKEVIDIFLGILDQKNFSIIQFLQVVNIVTNYLCSSSFIGEDLQTMLSTRSSLLESKVTKQIIKLPSSARAEVIMKSLFADNRFKKFWRQINASHIQGNLGNFCQRMHKEDFNYCKDMNAFMVEVRNIITGTFMRGGRFLVIHDSEQIYIDNNMMARLGLLSILRSYNILFLNPEVQLEVFKIKGLGTFIVELFRTINFSLDNKIDPLAFVNMNFEGGGLLFELMRLDLYEAQSFGVHIETSPDSYIGRMDLIDSREFDFGLCPAALPMMGDPEKTPIAQVYGRVVTSAIPKHLRKNLLQNES